MSERWTVIFLVLVLVLMSPVAMAAHGEPSDRGLVGHWTFNESTGDLRDWSGNGQTGEVVGDPVRQVGGVNNSSAYRFDGMDDWVPIDTTDVLDVGTNLTLEVWFRPDTVSFEGYKRIFLRAPWATYGMYMNGGGGLVFLTDTGERGGQWDAAAWGLPEPDRWYHAVGTYDGEQLRLYVDGELRDTKAQEGPIDRGNRTTGAVGAHTANKQYFDGDIDDIRVYNRTWNQTMVTRHYENPPGWHPVASSAGDGTENRTISGNETTSDNGTTDNTTEDTTTDNETSPDTGSTSDNETSDGDTSDGTTDDITTDNETTNGTTDDGSDDDTLFTGSNESDGTDDGGSIGNDSTATGDTGTNGSTNGSTDDTTVTDDGPGTDRAGIQLSIQPSRLYLTTVPGQQERSSLRVSNTGDRRTRVSVTSGLEMLSFERETLLIGPGSMEDVDITVSPGSGQAPGLSRGLVRLYGNGFSYTVPIDVVVRSVDEQQRVDFRFNVSDDRQNVSADLSVFNTGNASRVTVYVTSRILDRSMTPVREDVRSISVHDRSDIRLNGSGLDAGGYEWEVVLRSGDNELSASRDFIISDESSWDPSAERYREIGPEDTGPDLIVIVLALVAVTVAGLKRDRIREMVRAYI